VQCRMKLVYGWNRAGGLISQSAFAKTRNLKFQRIKKRQ